MRAMGAWLLAVLPIGGAAHAADVMGETIIVTAPGGDHDADDAQRIDAADITRGGTPDLIGAVVRSVPGLSLSEAQSNPFQPNLVYRGFVASPLQGNAQGLAVYLDGARFNQPFGDTVDFDLLPEAAIASITVKDAGPVYGLNALGGAIVVAGKTGRDFSGIALSAAGGRYRAGEGTLEGGWSDGAFSAYAAIEARHDGGWRRHSPSTLYNGYADIGWDGYRAGLHVKLIGADSDLTGNGSAPIELLAADRRAVFTFPDNTRNRYARVSLHSWIALSATTRIEASLYAQQLRQRTVNGDAADIDACADEERAGLLCLAGGDDEDAVTLSGRDGTPITDPGEDEYGVLNRSRTRTRAAGILAQIVDRRPLLGGDNMLIVGVSHDRSRTRFASSSELGTLEEDRSVAGLGPIIDQPDGAITPVLLSARTRYTGLFVSDTLPITSALSAEIGLRYNHARILLDDHLGTALNGRHGFHRINPGIEVDYRIAPSLTLRIGYSEANRAPTPVELSCADPEAPCSLTNFFVGDPPLKQVVARTFEAGASGERQIGGWSLRWLLSGWRTTNSDDIQFVASDVRGRAFFQNVGRTRRQGVELGADLARGPWAVHLAYAYIDATFRTPLTLNSPDNPSADEDGQIAVDRGDRLPGIPRHRAILSIDYQGERFSLGGDVQAQSGQVLTGDEGNDQRRTGAFAIVNASGSARIAGPVWLFAEVRNLFDRRYASFGTFSETSEVDLAEAPGASDPRSLSPGAPRRWMIGARARF